MITLYAIPYRTIVQILLTVTRHYCFGGGATWLAVACTMMALCDAHDNRVPVLHEVCVCRVAVMHATCVYIIFRVLYAPVSIMYSCMMGLCLATTSAAVVCNVESKRD